MVERSYAAGAITRGQDGFSAAAAASISGATYRQVDYWARTGLLEPSMRTGHGSGSQRRYAYDDIVALTVLAGVDASKRRSMAAVLRSQPLTADLCIVVQPGVASLMSKPDAISVVGDSDDVVTIVPLAPVITYVNSQIEHVPVREAVNG
jgi:hypothetical protein